MKINKFFFLYFLLFVGCATTVSEKNITNDVVNNFIKANAKSNYILINIDEQKLVYKSKFRTYTYPISSSVNGLGNKKNSYKEINLKNGKTFYRLIVGKFKYKSSARNFCKITLKKNMCIIRYYE